MPQPSLKIIVYHRYGVLLNSTFTLACENPWWGFILAYGPSLTFAIASLSERLWQLLTIIELKNIRQLQCDLCPHLSGRSDESLWEQSPDDCQK